MSAIRIRHTCTGVTLVVLSRAPTLHSSTPFRPRGVPPAHSRPVATGVQPVISNILNLPRCSEQLTQTASKVTEHPNSNLLQFLSASVNLAFFFTLSLVSHNHFNTPPPAAVTYKQGATPHKKPAGRLPPRGGGGGMTSRALPGAR